MYALAWDRAAERRHARRNLLQSVLLLGGMAALLVACGWIVAGADGALWALLGGALGLVLGPRVSPVLVLRMFRAQPLPRWQTPELHAVVDELSSAAGLERPPVLYYVPSPALNAFAVGTPQTSAIAVTDGMLRRLDLRELAGVLAHEISHIRNRDLWIMGLADTISRLTRLMSLLGLLLLLFSLPALLLDGASVPWLLVLLLVSSPTLAALLQLALSRTREFDADLQAAALTGDPLGLASALEKLERSQGWESLLGPARRGPEPSLLRSHPRTAERVRRLLSLQVVVEQPLRRVAIVIPDGLPPLRSRWHFPGLWY